MTRFVLVFPYVDKIAGIVSADNPIQACRILDRQRRSVPDLNYRELPIGPVLSMYKMVLCKPEDRGYFVYDSTGSAISQLAKNGPELWLMTLEMPDPCYVEKFRMPQPRRAIKDDEVGLNCNTMDELTAEIAAA